MKGCCLLSLRRALFQRAILLVVLVLPVLLPACQYTSSSPPQTAPTNSFLQEVERYANARQRSLELRKGLEAIAKAPAKGSPNKIEDLLPRLREQKREYFAVREILFETAMLHASAVVERPERQNLNSILLRTSLALMAGTDLVRNFHALASLLNDHPEFRRAWNEADQEHGISEGSWETSLQAHRNSQYQDLFKGGIERLKRYRGQLEGLRNGNSRLFPALYPQGIDAAFKEADQAYALLRAGYAGEDLGRDEKAVRALVERSKALRSEWATSAPLLRQAIGQDRGLIRGNVHVRVHAAKREYLDLREALYHLAFKHVAKLTRTDIAYPRPFRLRAIGISLLAAVTLYENAHQLQTHILPIPGVRTLLNQGDPALGIPPGFWTNIESEFVTIAHRNLLEAGIQAIEEEQNLPDRSWVEQDPFLDYVSRELSASAAAAEMRDDRFHAKIGRALRYQIGRLSAMGMGGLQGGKFQLSRGFGNLTGMIEFRKGKLFNQPHWVKFVKERLEPGDLLLEKTPFKLTDQLIPGHFGHVALYVGTEPQLLALGLIDHPWVARYQKQLAEGRVIVEALRDGTQINTIERFLNIDDLAILRPKKDKIPHADVIQAITLAFSHIGKKYDFDFDNNTWDTIVCSELAFQTYINVRWPFARMLTSYTISPDDIAVLGGPDPGRAFDLITFIHDGQVVHDRATGLLNEKKYIELLGRRYAEAGR